MTADELLKALEARFAEIEGELERASAAERPRVRQEIVGLFRETEQTLERLTAFKERIRGLVERYKTMPGARRPRHPRPGRPRGCRTTWGAPPTWSAAGAPSPRATTRAR
jgi:hypothetical protein